MTTSSSEFEINLTSEQMADDTYVKRLLETKLKVLQEIANATDTDLNTGKGYVPRSICSCL